MEERPVRVRVLSDTVGASMTKQAFKDECDINYLIQRFKQSGELPRAAKVGEFGDFGSNLSFHDCMNIVAAGREAFMEWPAHIRDYFRNDPGLVSAYLQDPDRKADLEELGILEREAEEKALLVRVEAPEEPVEKAAPSPD